LHIDILINNKFLANKKDNITNNLEVWQRERERGVKSLRRFIIGFVSIFLVIVIVSGIFIKCTYFSHKLPTKSIKMEDIKSVQIINLDRSKDRREHYEKMLRDNFGDKFLGHKIGDEIRLNAVDGKKDVILENLSTGQKFDYNQLKDKDMVEIFNKDLWKGYIRSQQQYYIYFANEITHDKDDVLMTMLCGVGSEHIRSAECIVPAPAEALSIVQFLTVRI